MNVRPGDSYRPILKTGVPGLLGTIKLGLLDEQGGYTTPLAATGIIETPAGSGIYVGTRTAPDQAGSYAILWSLDGTTDPDQVQVQDLLVTYSLTEALPPSGTDLCTVADVTAYVPGYVSEPATDDLLARLVTSESQEVLRETNREIVPFGDQPQTRAFEISATAARKRVIPIGDLATIADSDFAVELLDANEANPITVDAENVRALYRRKRQPLEQWEPVTQLELLPAAQPLRAGGTMLVTGNWGFPQIPPFIREATAKRVILRYVSDVAATGTAFADAIDNVNLAGLFASARDAVDRLRQKALVR